jgi:Zn finger protein HypA/HybF involved in hydrogenase expression
MARALQVPMEDSLFKKHPKLAVRLGGYSYAVERQSGSVMYSVSDGTNTMSAPIRWAFGVGSQTFVVERDGKLYESLVSYYPVIDGLDTTMGDDRVRPASLLQAMGREVSSQEAQGCFECHSTGAVSNHQLQLETMKPGVRCEHCHVGASQHLEAISHNKLDSVPPKLQRLSPEDLSNFCGQCHRSWETVVKGHLFGPVNVRFQPYRLATSKCFDGVDGRMSCVACHNPHEEIVRDEKSYDPKCLACHSAAAKLSVGMLAAYTAGHSGGTGEVKMKTCPVSKSDCVSCHMPKMKLPGGHMIFADHDIRVVHAGEPYPN